MARKLEGKYNFVKWEKPGDAVTGILRDVRTETINGRDVPCLVVTDKNGHEVTATAGKIVRDMIEKYDLRGKVIRVEYVKLQKKSNGDPLKLFDVFDLSDEYPNADDFLRAAEPLKGGAAGDDDDDDDDLPF